MRRRTAVGLATLATLLASCADSSDRSAQADQELLHAINETYLCEVDASRGAVPVGIKAPEAVLSGTFTPQQENLQRFRLPNDLDGNKLTIYFTTNSWALEGNDRRDLGEYVRRLHDGPLNILLEAYADPRGSGADNDRLARNRGRAVRDFMRGLGVDANFDIVSYGESRSESSDAPRTREEKLELRPDRRVTIMPDENIVSRALSLFPADIYLLDQSGSMGDRLGHTTKWGAVQAYTYPEDSSVFAFATPIENCGSHIEDRRPEGGTPLYFALESVIKQADKGDVITILSDGADTEGGMTVRELVQLANSKDLKINTIALQGGSYSTGPLRELARGTGGGTYERKE